MVNNNYVENDEKGIRLEDLLYVLKKHFKAIVGFAIVGLIVGVLVSFAIFVKGIAKVEYYVSASIAVTSTDANGLFSANSANPNATDIHLAEDITDAVIYVCKSDVTLNAAADRLQLIGVTADDIRPNLSLSQYEETQIIEMTLRWDNAEEGKLILEAITEVVPDILINTLKIGDVSIVNPPKVKTNSLSFINIKIVFICFALGAFVSCAFYLAKFFVHPTFLHSEDIKDSFDLDILGEIPGDKEYFNHKINSSNSNDYSSVQEHFNSCAHVLAYKLKNYKNVCVYITSSASQEGKSSVTANIGYALSDLGYKTLIIDMDVRNPSLTSKFVYDKDDMHTMNAVYRGDIDVCEAVISINDNLDIIPTKLENAKLRIDNKMIEIINSAKVNYDFLIMDTAPVGQVSDSMNLNNVADCAIFLVRQDQVWINTISDCISRLRKSGITLIGAIMNDVKGGSDTYYYNRFDDSPYVVSTSYTKKKSKKNRHMVTENNIKIAEFDDEVEENNYKNQVLPENDSAHINNGSTNEEELEN